MSNINRLLIVLIVIVLLAIFLRRLPGKSPDKGHLSYGL